MTSLTTFRYSGLSLSECDIMDSLEMPPKKRLSGIHNNEELMNDQTSSSTSFFNLSDMKSDCSVFSTIPPVNITPSHKRPISQMSLKSTSPTPHSGYPTASPLPTMSKLTMNIGYAKHLASNNSAPQIPHHAGQAVLEPSYYSSFNLLSNKRLHGPASQKDSLSLGNGQVNDPFSYQQAHLEVRAPQQESQQQDYPLQSPLLNSMYANSANSSSINDFKLLMAQTSISDFSNWNDGTIWQPRPLSRPLSKNSSSTNSLFSQDDTIIQTLDYNDSLDDVPSFDEAMDMMMASR